MDPEAQQETKEGRAGLTIEARQPARQHVTSRTVSGGDAPPDTSVADVRGRVPRAVEAAGTVPSATVAHGIDSGRAYRFLAALERHHRAAVEMVGAIGRAMRPAEAGEVQG